MFGKVVAAAAVTSLAFCGAAFAADLPSKAPAYLNPKPISSWDGLYVGVHGGYASGDADVLAVAPPGVRGSGSPKGGFGGAQIGYNYLLTPNWLLGTEVDVSFGDVNDSLGAGLAPSNFKVDTFGTVRGRFGYVHGPWLLYATGGTAWAKSDMTAAGAIDNNRVYLGWTGGVGVEYAFAPSWSLKAEYLYADFGDTKRTFPGGPFVVNADMTMSMVRVGLNYHFGPFGNAAQTSSIPVKAPAMRTAALWSGPYIGLHGGYGFGDFRTSVGGLNSNLDTDGGFGGFQTGYNWRLPQNWVIGIETDASWGSLNDSRNGDSAKIDAMGTARGRLGYAMNNMLLYGTGGLAYAHLKSTSGLGAVPAGDQNMLGWTLGLGAEYAFSPLWSAKAEYAYAGFGEINDHVLALTVHDKLNIQTFKVGLNYHASLLSLLANR